MSALAHSEVYGDDLTTFQSALSELPSSMLLGPGGAPNPPSNEIYDERGMLVWDRFTKTLLWGMWIRKAFRSDSRSCVAFQFNFTPRPETFMAKNLHFKNFCVVLP